MTLHEIRRLDPTGMYDWIKGFPDQVEEAVRIGTSARIRVSTRGIRNIVLAGLGGSAIGGDLLRSYLSGSLAVPFIVNRHYTLPVFVDRSTLLIVSSYSGNTEETIAAHREAIRRKAKILCVTTGGQTATIATRHQQPVLKIPAGLQPRAALGYSFFPLLVVFSSLKLIPKKEKEIKETLDVLRRMTADWSDPASPENAPLRLAEAVKGNFPIVYSSVEHFDAVGLRWRGQIAENAKQLGFGHVLPEMNHNELVGWKALPDLLKRFHVVFLRDKQTHKRVAMREEITKSILTGKAGGVHEVWSQGESLLARMFSLVYFGDWFSLYLACLNRENPTPVEVIDQLKSELAKV